MEKNAKIPKASFGTAKAFFLEISPLFLENQTARGLFVFFRRLAGRNIFRWFVQCCSMSLGVARCSSVFLGFEVLGVGWCSSVLLGVSRCCSVLLGVPRSVLRSLEVLGVARCSSVLLGVPRCSPVLLGVARCSSVFLGVARCSSVFLSVPRFGCARCSSVLLGVPQCCSWSVCLAATLSTAGSLRMKWNNSRKTFGMSGTTFAVFLRFSPSQQRHQNAKSHTCRREARKLTGGDFVWSFGVMQGINSDIDFQQSSQSDNSNSCFRIEEKICWFVLELCGCSCDVS